MILFKEIYDMAINLFDDPDIRKAYIFDMIRCQKMLYPYLSGGVKLFTNPMSIAIQLINQTQPYGQIEVFDGDGSSEYSASIVPIDNSLMQFKIGRDVDTSAKYDKETGVVTFSKNVEVGTKCSFEYYFAGCFNADFKSSAAQGVTSDMILYYVKEIIARALILEWAEKEKNSVLEIRNILTDTDFKIYSPANSIKAKVDWVKDLRFQFDNFQTKLGWLAFGSVRGGGQKYGP